MAKKLKDEELKKVQDLNNKFLQTKVKIADAVLGILKSSSEVDGIQAEFAGVEKELIEAYGESAVIDLRTGEVKEPEKETSESEDQSTKLRRGSSKGEVSRNKEKESAR